MKKLMFAMAITATVGFAQAALTSTGFESTGFEAYYKVGEPVDTDKDDAGYAAESDTRVWVSATDVESTVKAYGADDADAKPTITGVAAENLGNNYLAVEGKIERLAQAGGTAVEIGDGLYIDTVVKFSATDAEAEGPDGVEEGDKLCVWLKGNEEDDTQCTLMITAGYIATGSGDQVLPKNYTTTTKLANNSWHRLQVKALPPMDGGYGFLGNGFVVYIDGEAVVATEAAFNTEELEEGDEIFYDLEPRAKAYADYNKLFPSLIPAEGAGDNTITSLAFKGSGAVDNISFTQGTDPNPQRIAEADMPAAVTGLVEGTDAKYGVEGNLEDAAYEFSGEYTITKDTKAGTYIAIATLLEGWAWSDGTTAPTNITWTIASSGSGSDGYDSGDGESKFTIDPAKEATLTAKLQSAGKTLGDVADATTGMTYAQAYALGLFNEETGDVADLDATISVGADGKVTVSLANAPTTGYLVTCKVYEKASLTAEWPVDATATYEYGKEQAITPPDSSTAGFYKVEVAISNALGE